MTATIAHPFGISFEFFPPNTPEMEETLWRSIKRLEPLGPSFVSVTYGAAGSTRERTHRTVRRILEETSLVPAAHLTCVGATQSDIHEVADDYWAAGVRHIVALRGDPPAGATSYTPHTGGYPFAAELVSGLRARRDFEISVAAYPEVHPEAGSAQTDLDNLKRKIDAGATRAITQFFFFNDVYFRFVERAQRAGISVPIVPGIMPVTNFVQMRRFAEKAGASVPDNMARLFEGLENDPDTRKLVAATVVAEQVQTLARQGVKDFHFYTLNRADLSFAICHILGLRPRPSAVSVEP
jgi:methylenetetrahydrofolate reductase (NADPH)